MQTLTTADFNRQYPENAWDTNKGYVTFNDDIAVWGNSKKQSLLSFHEEVGKEIRQIKEKKQKTKEVTQARIALTAESKKEKADAEYQEAIRTIEPKVIFNRVTYNKSRIDITYTIAGQTRTRNASIELAESLLNFNQRKLFAEGKRKTFAINRFDFASILVAGGKRPGMIN